jgi:hypothetical protein
METLVRAFRCMIVLKLLRRGLFVRPMLAAVPAAHLTMMQTDANAKRPEPPALDAEVQQHTVLFHHSAASIGTRLFQSRLNYRGLRDAL